MAQGKKKKKKCARVCSSALCMTEKHVCVLLPLQKAVKLLVLQDKHFRGLVVAEVSTHTHTRRSGGLWDDDRSRRDTRVIWDLMFQHSAGFSVFRHPDPDMNFLRMCVSVYVCLCAPLEFTLTEAHRGTHMGSEG